MSYKNHKGASLDGAPAPLASGGIPCCVPYWDSREFLQLGGLYSDKDKHYLSPDAYMDDFHQWLPRKWQDRGIPSVPSLLPDMLPSSTWENNLRTLLTDDEWDRLRRFCYQAAGHACVACGSRGEPHVEAHEAWQFDEQKGIQKLVGLLCLCPTCHKAKHLGFANRLGILPQVLARLKWLNEWNEAQLKSELEKVTARQEAYSLREWTLDLSFLGRYGVR